MIPDFSLHQPASVEEAAQLLADHGKAANVLAGGTDLVPRMKAGRSVPDHIVDVKAIDRLKTIAFDERAGTVTIGASVTHRSLESSPVVRDRFPLLAQLERTVGNVRVRTIGTLGGNLCAADPQSDPPTLLLAYGARLRVANSRSTRVLGVDDFLVGAGRTALDPDELLLAVEIPELAANVSGVYLRYCPGERPLVAIALFVEWSGNLVSRCTLVAGCVEATPISLKPVEERLKNMSRDDIAGFAVEAGRQAGALTRPSDDIFASSGYKRHLVSHLVTRAIRQIRGEGGHE